ncbi:MAG: PAS domain S-box protein [Prolixibacteraceae bacterium]|nr:PAS domain S-box protein [Prolixibacteraceae bacterium]
MDNVKKPIRILFAEDLPTDVEKARREIRKGGIDFISTVVDNEADFLRELENFNPDIVVSDYSMPTFDGMTALKITRKKFQYMPFVVLTGSMNEETAVACMKAGANDYVIKEQIKRLPFAIHEAIEKSNVRKERAEMEQKLLQSLEEYKELINGMQETVWIIETSGKLLEVNKSAIETLGYSRDELLKIGLQGIDKHLSPKELADLGMRMATVKSQFFHTWHTTKSGKKIPVEINSTLVNYRGQKVIMSIARDMTERIEIENQLKLLSRSVEQSPVGTIITDPDGNIEYVNNAFSKISGYSSDEIIGENPRNLKSGYHPTEFYKNLWVTIKSGKEWHGELKNKNKIGDSYWSDVSISPMLDNKGQITHFVCIFEDISEKKEMIDNLVAAKEKAEESDRLKSAFLANMSHEIRTPMNGIMGFTQLLKEPKLSGNEKDNYIKIIQKSSQRMLNTINDLIEISKIESGNMELKVSPVNINEQLEFLHKFFKPETDSKNLSFTLDMPLPDEQAVVETDQEKLYGVLTNLIKNAVKYTHTGGIETGYRQVNNSLEFFIKDSGIGIEEPRQNVVFDRFVQADISISKPYEGAGLGLSIAKAYVEMLGGKIWLKSEIGIGTQFFFSIPYTPKETAKPPIEQEKNASNGDSILKDLTILIAEDDLVGQIYLSELLKGKCKKIYFAENGKEAVQLVSENPDINLVLMDIKMPVMDGYEATAKIKEINPKVVVIGQSAYAMTDDTSKAISAGCDDYITKPINAAMLFEKITKNLPG